MKQALDSLMSQPQDDPVLQRVVAQHIVSAVSATDGCGWTLYDVSRSSKGWNLTYLCDKSSQIWDRQNKSTSKLVIGEFKNKEPNPKLMSACPLLTKGSTKNSADEHAQADRRLTVEDAS